MALLLTVEDAATSPMRVFSPGFRQSLSGTNPFLRYEELERLVADRDTVQAMLYLDTSIVLPDLFLEKVDRSTMANSMEVRVPFLDNDLVDFALSLSSQEKLAGGELKGLLKRALAGVVPDEILNAPKTGFGVPYEAWLKGPLKDHLRNTLLEPRNRIGPTLDARVVRGLIDQHLAGRRDHGFLLWKLMQLSMWMNEYDVACA
jgi:asparagine synthase (glutamine-hydrolysing)